MPHNNEIKFSKREKEILKLIMEGFSRKMIKAALKLSINTVDDYLKSVRHKTSTHSRAELLHFLYKNQALLLDAEIAA